MTAAGVYRFAKSKDPTAEMLKEIGDLSKVKVAGGRVLVWPYVRSLVLASGLIAGTDKTAKEDVYQSAVGYVLKKGPLAFQDDEQARIFFGGFSADVGEWVTYSPGDGKRIQIRGVDCRYVEDALIQGVVDDPTIVTHKS